jgi:transcriptional antiterminator NusG
VKNWVILFVQTGLEEKLTRSLKEKLNADEFLPFLPAKEAPRRSKGVIYKERRTLFPGYIFIQTEIETGLIAEKLEAALKDAAWPEGVYSLLHYGDNKKDVTIRANERQYWERLFDEDFCIRGSIGIIEGDTVKVTSGPLIGMESQIKKIDRHKRIATLEVNILGSERIVKLMLEVVEKRPKKQ